MNPFLKLGFNINSKLITLLSLSYMDYSKVASSFKDDFLTYSFFKDIEFVKSFGVTRFRKNFFTIFMLSLIRFSRAKEEEIIKYGKVIFYLRSIITCVDNIIDNERKGVLFLNTISETATNNSLLSLVLQNNLTKELSDVSGYDISTKVLDDIYKIACSEGKRDRELYKSYPSFEFILSEIHSGIGGELLKIGISPLLYSRDDKLVGKLSEALFTLGLSLQALDDLCDIREDFEAGKINLATSFFIENKKIEEKDAVEIDIYKDSLTKKYLDIVVSNAKLSFLQLERAGYPANQRDCIIILETLFEIRGVKKLWEIVK